MVFGGSCDKWSNGTNAYSHRDMKLQRILRIRQQLRGFKHVWGNQCERNRAFKQPTKRSACYLSKSIKRYFLRGWTQQQHEPNSDYRHVGLHHQPTSSFVREGATRYQRCTVWGLFHFCDDRQTHLYVQAFEELITIQLIQNVRSLRYWMDGLGTRTIQQKHRPKKWSKDCV